MANLGSDVDALRRVPLFSKVPLSKLKLLAFACDRLRFRPGDRLFAQGDYGDAAYVILSGSVDITVAGDGASVKVAELGEYEFVGEMAILCDMPRTATASASTSAAQPLETLKIDRNAFFDLMETSPQIAIEMTRVLARRLASTTRELLARRA